MRISHIIHDYEILLWPILFHVSLACLPLSIGSMRSVLILRVRKVKSPLGCKSWIDMWLYIPVLILESEVNILRRKYWWRRPATEWRWLCERKVWRLFRMVRHRVYWKRILPPHLQALVIWIPIVTHFLGFLHLLWSHVASTMETAVSAKKAKRARLNFIVLCEWELTWAVSAKKAKRARLNFIVLCEW